MALIKCPDCGLENVSSSAVACPNCSYPIKENYEIRIAKQQTLSGTKYCNVLSGATDMFFWNGIEPGATGKCTVFDILTDYCITPEGDGIFINGDKISGRWAIVEDYLLPPCGPYSGEIPDGNEFTASCSNSLVRCENLSFYPNGTFSETVSGKTVTGVYVRCGYLIALCERNCLQPEVYVIYHHKLWGSCHIKDEKAHLLTEIVSLCLEFASAAEALTIPVTPVKEANTNTPQQEEKSVGGTIAKIWFWLILAFVGGFAFISADSPFLAAVCFIVFPIIAIWTYIMGPSSLHKMMDDDAKKQHDKKMNGGYTCPNCGRKAGHPISAVSKGVSVGAFGLASNKIGKSYKCEGCGYMW